MEEIPFQSMNSCNVNTKVYAIRIYFNRFRLFSKKPDCKNVEVERDMRPRNFVEAIL
jgi:hypothetical protein